MFENSFVTGDMTPIISTEVETLAIFHFFSATLVQVHQVIAAGVISMIFIYNMSGLR